MPLKEILPKLPKVHLIRSKIRLGLMKARTLGAVNAKGPVLVIMDAHMEVSTGWLPPLLDPIATNPKTVTFPAIETLGKDSLCYMPDYYYRSFKEDLILYVGGFNWNMLYTWIEVPNKGIDPVRSPTMLGAAFVIRKDYFEALGYYDPGFEIWGAENLELSFKVWMCGGEMFQSFCSHTAHMYRTMPYWASSQKFVN